MARVAQNRIEDASKDVLLARNLIEDNHLGEAGLPPLELAQVSFALGEIRRLKSEQLVFVPMPSDFGAQLEVAVDDVQIDVDGPLLDERIELAAAGDLEPLGGDG